MHNKIIITAIFTFFLTANSFAQDEQQEPDAPNTIERQFTDLMKESNNFQEYKVVKRAGLDRLKSNTNDSINALKIEINGFKKELGSQEAEINKLNASLADTKTTLDTTREKIDSINFLGIPMKKSGYKSLMWGIIALLGIALAFFVFRFRGSNIHTKDARKKLAETEQEFDVYRKKALEKQQELGRQLQDERNKAVRNSKG